MGFTCGIIGLPNVGKSTLFNAITAARAEASNYPFCTIDPNVGIVEVPDDRVAALATIYQPARIVHTTIEFLDIAGLVRGASRGEGLGNQFLSHIRDVDAIVHVVRCFDDPNVVHVDGDVNPRRDIEVIETELLLKDLDTVERKLADTQKRAKTGEKKLKMEADAYAKVRDHIVSGRLVRYLESHNDEERHWVRELHLLTGKPVMYVCNVHERDIEKEAPYVRTVKELAAKEGASVAVISAAVEAEVAELQVGERRAFLDGLGLKESGMSQVIREGYGLLRLITFFTVGSKEVHAWTARTGSTAIDAAGMVHSDFARGFIRAEIMKFGDIARLGSEQAIRDHGLLQIQGRDYVIEDGDVVHIRFNI